MRINLDDGQIAYINYELQTIANRLLKQIKKCSSMGFFSKPENSQKLEEALEYLLRFQAILQAWRGFALLDKDLERRNESIDYIDTLLEHSSFILTPLRLLDDEAVAEPVNTD